VHYAKSLYRAMIPLGIRWVGLSSVARLRDMEAFRYQTLLHLLSAEDLTLISIWNPSFLTALVAPLSEWQDRLCFDLGRRNRSSGRATALEKIFRPNLTLPEKLRLVWPRLALISCWAEAAASYYLRELRETLPEVEIQPKGLLATEAFVSFPLLGRAAAVLALRSHFFEFQESDGEACPGRARGGDGPALPRHRDDSRRTISLST
jgi:hypothetical protein